MTKSTVSKLFIGSVIAIAGGVVLLAAGLFLAYVNGRSSGGSCTR